MRYSVPYGKHHLIFKIPKDFEVNNVNSKLCKPITNIISKTKESILSPINSLPLLELVKGKKSACILVTDITRECPDKELLPPILETLETELKKEDILILIASGMHRKMTVDEKISKYGKKIVENYMIIDHDSRDEKKLVNLGTTKHGTKIHVSRLAFESELLISLGVVEPHQFAGYSGGFKTMAIGAAGDATISQTHSLNMLTNPKTGLTKLEGNPVYEDIIEIGKKTGLKFVVNVVIGKEQQILEIKSGEPQETQNVLIKFSQEINEIPVNKSYDVAICGVGFPKDTNLYQVSRAASYLFFASIKVIKEGGYIIIPARCEEGAGQGVGEQRFFSMLKNKSLKGIINSTSEFKAGEQRAFFMANVLSHYKVIIVDSLVPEIISDAKMIPAKNMAEAFEMVKNDLGSNLDLILIPKSLSTLPILAKSF